jgi:hypothetical protein
MNYKIVMGSKYAKAADEIAKALGESANE